MELTQQAISNCLQIRIIIQKQRFFNNVHVETFVCLWTVIWKALMKWVFCIVPVTKNLFFTITPRAGTSLQGKYVKELLLCFWWDYLIQVNHEQFKTNWSNDRRSFLNTIMEKRSSDVELENPRGILQMLLDLCITFLIINTRPG